MCGIFCIVSRHGYQSPSSNGTCLLQHRGPDSLQEHRTKLKTEANEDVYLSFSSSVLSLRGTAVVSQPLVDETSGSVLCWNGEAWKLSGNTVQGNDSKALFELLVLAAVSAESYSNVLSILEETRGPYALVFYDGHSKKLYFGRDCLGRRSLLRTSTTTGDLVISSVCDLTLNTPWFEIEAEGVHVIDLSLPAPTEPSLEHTFPEHLVPHTTLYLDPPGQNIKSITLPYSALNKTIPSRPESRMKVDSTCVSAFGTLLGYSLELRVKNIREQNEAAIMFKAQPEPRVAILFSGGLDCTLLARLTHDMISHTEPIDLLNVAFENPRIHKTESAPYEICPDRITARASFAELQLTCPGRKFRLICINVPFTESRLHRQKVVDLIHPHNTEMDLSIAFALYFASRGVGTTAPDNSKPEEIIQCTTPARVLLSGLGADELFGGYQRHAVAFSRKGHSGLLDELDLDISRLGKRNLGRDDRVISHWGKEARYPYLDEDVVAWALRAPLWEKMGFGIGADESSELEGDAGDQMQIEDGKLLLRLLAWKLGMPRVAREKKRAIQFGARTAKMEGGRTKGTQLL